MVVKLGIGYGQYDSMIVKGGLINGQQKSCRGVVFTALAMGRYGYVEGWYSLP